VIRKHQEAEQAERPEGIGLAVNFTCSPDCLSETCVLPTWGSEPRCPSWVGTAAAQAL